MSTGRLDGKKLKEMLIGGAEGVRRDLSEINDLNVFPVPDGDTGTNMTKTIEGGIAEISALETDKVSEIMDRFAHGMLLGARGNSGVILSQIFAGIKGALEDSESVSALELAEAYKGGIEKSYASVMNPTEGTILTVFRESSEYAAKMIDENSSIEDFYKYHIEEAERSLARTKEILPVLAEADVVDSGGAGYLCIARGMYRTLTGEMSVGSYSYSVDAHAPTVDINSFTRDSVLEFGYCTEFLLRLMTAKTDPDAFCVDTVRGLLEELGGESIVAYKEGDVVKVHVHTFDPGRVLSECRRFGEFLTVKIENMSLGHSGSAEKKPSDGPKFKINPKKSFAVLAVATGEGLSSLFTDMGADGIISGGQTSNPSTEEFIEEFKKYKTEHIIVLPNNKNVYLAANQAAELYTDAKVHIVHTATLMQGYGALSVITPGITDIDVLVSSAESAAKGVLGSEITRAVRNVTINGVEVHEGDYISITDGRITSVEESAEEALTALLDEVDTDDYEILTLFVGKDVSDERRADITEKIEELYPELELTVYKGGQEVYDYLIALE